MRISSLTPIGDGWQRFNLNVGGFTIRNCYWNIDSRHVFFPRRYDRNGRRHRVVFVHGALVNRLRALLESGEMGLPRDRRPCMLRIYILGFTNDQQSWAIFNFTVRGFTILGCRWQPNTGSIQLPVTFFPDASKRRVVCAYGAHINRLRQALEEHWDRIRGYSEEMPIAAGEAI